jgi:hypothetical protein
MAKPNNLDQAQRSAGGERGGRSTSAAKVQAAKINGCKGGRPTGPGKKKRMLIEYLLRKKLTPSQLNYAWGALDKLDWNDGATSEAARFRKQFFLEKWNGIGFRIDLSTTEYRVDRSVSSSMEVILRKFRKAAHASLCREKLRNPK